jgi:hypothetical protein
VLTVGKCSEGTPCGVPSVFRARVFRVGNSSGSGRLQPAAGSNPRDSNSASCPLRASCLLRIGPTGFEPVTKGLCVPLRLSPPLSGSWSGPSLPVAGLVFQPPAMSLPSGLYTFRKPQRADASGLARDWHAGRSGLAFPEFDRFYQRRRKTTLATRSDVTIRHWTLRCRPLKSPALTIELRSRVIIPRQLTRFPRTCRVPVPVEPCWSYPSAEFTCPRPSP